MVATNESGVSSAAPVAGTAPHVWAYVDFTPPIIQLHSVRQSSQLGRPMIQIRWTAVDANLGPRPIDIRYRALPDETWNQVNTEPLANTGQYDWILPDQFRGAVAIRVSVEDEGGNRVHSQSQVAEITQLSPTSANVYDNDTLHSATPMQTVSGRDNSTASRAKRLFDNAMELKQEGNITKSIAGLREVVRIQPDFSQAFVEMADMLAGLGDHERALNAYELALRNQPTMRRALLGAARGNIKLRNHNEAARALRLVLQQSPDDAESWLSLGDVAVFQGDELLARECYTRATQVDPKATGVITEAQKRLAVMSSVSRAYRPSGR
jgi:cytochrome c-type biogenesis protein CcmH/NrfG